MAKPRKKKSNKVIWILLGVFVVLIAVAVVFQKNKKKETEVEISTAQKITIVEKINASGMVQPVTEVKLSPDVAGEIIELNVEEGDSVVLGQLLVRIRPDNYILAVKRAEASLNTQKANLMSSKANLARAQATFDRSKLELDRNERLFNENVISSSDWELAQQTFKIADNDLKSARASVDASRYVVISSQASLDDANENLRKTSMYAPISGTVSKKSVLKGERVVGTSQFAGTEMLRLANLNLMEVRVDVNENDIIRISEGDTAIIDVDAYTYLDKKFRGVVTQIANTAKDKASADAVTEFEVKIRILRSSFIELEEDGYRHPFKPGMTASVEIITETKENVLAVPLAAVTVRSASELNKDDEEGDDKKSRSGSADKDGETVEVIFLNEGGVAKIFAVKTGLSDFENIEITNELSDTSKIITGPFLVVSKRLKDGDLVVDKSDGKDKKDEEEEDESEE
ncbi:MAG: efflux transporter periplasmic adaptor subunit [Bacteroidetes bacterium]|nr:MAG: efflux transporter periplasmic adaptor subunit [Bacteroidota bacterium]